MGVSLCRFIYNEKIWIYKKQPRLKNVPPFEIVMPFKIWKSLTIQIPNMFGIQASTVNFESQRSRIISNAINFKSLSMFEPGKKKNRTIQSLQSPWNYSQRYFLLQNSGEPIKWPFEIPQPTVLGRVQVVQEHFVLARPAVGQDPGGTGHQLSPVQIPCHWSLHLPRSQWCPCQIKVF